MNFNAADTYSIMKGRKNCSTHHNNYKSHS